jgi:hypothetical protein
MVLPQSLQANVRIEPLIRPGLLRSAPESESYVMTDGQSASLS